jgi:hypothetical protein
MTIIWFVVWLVAELIGDHEALRFDPLNWWTATLILANRARPQPAAGLRTPDKRASTGRVGSAPACVGEPIVGEGAVGAPDDSVEGDRCVLALDGDTLGFIEPAATQKSSGRRSTARWRLESIDASSTIVPGPAHGTAHATADRAARTGRGCDHRRYARPRGRCS